ncbi:MAG: SsrA-binding protein SmpB [Acidobacteria bacterium]|nr:SsrA-binding protein SmpB [Acidobacteriota bacterium]
MEERKLVANNRKAYHDYEILERYEAGMALTGAEVKSIREGKIQLRDGYALIRKGEAFLMNCHISPYSHEGDAGHDATRSRKLLLHKHQIKRLMGKTAEKGLTLIPLSVYFLRGKAKVELGLGRGRKTVDRREAKRKKAVEREIRTAIKRGRAS